MAVEHSTGCLNIARWRQDYVFGHAVEHAGRGRAVEVRVHAKGHVIVPAVEMSREAQDFQRPVKALASRRASIVASVPELVKRTISAEGTNSPPVRPSEFRARVPSRGASREGAVARLASTTSGWLWPRSNAP